MTRIARPTPASSLASLRARRPATLALLAMATLFGALACGGSSTRPSRLDLTGTWNGTGSYPNAPFELILTQTDGTLRGSYSDQHDTSVSVNGTVNQSSITIAVDFGDAQLHFDGTVETVRRVTGTMRTSALGNTPFPFTMTR
jgi:hypothetical protein